MSRNIELSGNWYNQHDSQLDLHVDEHGMIEGIFRMGVSTSTSADSAYRLLGFVRGVLICFSVDFGDHGTLTSWTGHHHAENGGESLYTMWQMSVYRPTADVAVNPGDRWRRRFEEHFRVGSDVFFRRPYRGDAVALARAPSHPVI